MGGGEKGGVEPARVKSIRGERGGGTYELSVTERAKRSQLLLLVGSSSIHAGKQAQVQERTDCV